MKFSKFNIFVKKKDDEYYYLFNTLTGSTFVVDENVKGEIEAKNVEYFDPKIIEDYTEKGILVKDEVDENRYFDYAFNKSKHSASSLSLTVLLTQDCNLRCVYCYEGAGELNKGSLNNETRENIYKFIVNQVESRRSNLVYMVLFGGEPLLNFRDNIEWLDKIKKYCDDNNKQFVTSIVSNGILFDDFIMEKLSEYNCEGIQITLDGVKEIHDKRRIYKNGKGSFDEVIAGIKKVHDYNKLPNPVIRINIDKTNLSETKELLQYLYDENLSDCTIDFGIVKDTTQACAGYSDNCLQDDQLGDILERLHDDMSNIGYQQPSRTPTKRAMFCGMYNDSSFTITPTGDVYKCWDHVGYEEHRMGHIDESGELSDIQYAYYDWMTYNPLSVEECSKCAYLPVCGGGCGSISYNKAKSYHASGCFKVKGVLENEIISYFLNKEELETNKKVEVLDENY